MTEFTQFVPSPAGPFQFQPTLDGSVYTVTVSWNTYGQRWYVNIFDLAQNRIATFALIGSIDPAAIQAVSWEKGVVTVVTTLPHGYLIGTTAMLTISGVLPDAYNGMVKVLVTSDTQFSYALSGDPGGSTKLGIFGKDINLAAGYFSTSTLVYRESTQTFEVSP